MKKTLFFLLSLLFCASISVEAKKETTPLKVISYNIRMGEADDGTNSWQYRYPASAMMISDQAPDIFGLQEAFDYQVKYMNEFCLGYKSVGVGREDGKKKGEHMSIFYKTSRIKLLKWGTYWLSETPDVPSKGWDAACIRTATWALMKDKATGRKFYYVNTHLDHKGVEARKNGLAVIVERIGLMNKEGYPMVLTGDFNMQIGNPAFVDLKQIMKNARETGVKTDDKNSFNGWGKGNSTIDYVWYSGFSSCLEFQTITKEYMERKFISDHYPVSATLVF